MKTFYFNDLRTCCYLLWDQTLECVIVDPGCYSDSEKGRIVKFVKENGLKPVKILCTHGHFDHILGAMFVSDEWQIPIYMSHEDMFWVKMAPVYCDSFGYSFTEIVKDIVDVKDEDIITFGDSKLQVIHTPGHSQGCVCYYNSEQNYLISGDTLFAQSIGRTDLPGGDLDKIKESIINRLFHLPGDTIVYPGHGTTTDIATEKGSNPFLF